MCIYVCVCVCVSVRVSMSVCVPAFLYVWRHKICGFVSTPVIGWIESWLSMLACIQRYRNGRPGSDTRFLVKFYVKGVKAPNLFILYKYIYIYKYIERKSQRYIYMYVAVVLLSLSANSDGHETPIETHIAVCFYALCSYSSWVFIDGLQAFLWCLFFEGEVWSENQRPGYNTST